MHDPDETSSLLPNTDAIDTILILGPSDKVFRGPVLSVVYRVVRPGAFGPYRCSQAKFTIALGSTSGVFNNETATGRCQERPLSEGCVVCTSPNVERHGRWDRAGEILELHVKPRFLRKMARNKVEALFARDSIPEASRDPMVRELAGAICFLCSETEPDSSLILDNAALITKRLVVSHAFPRSISMAPKLAGERRERMERFIEANMGKRFRAPAFARAVGLSPQQFTPLCRATTGKSPMAYVWECRLLKARELARSGKHSRRDIVHLCGFADVSHLNRRFKARFRFPLRVLLESASRSKQS